MATAKVKRASKKAYQTSYNYMTNRVKKLKSQLNKQPNNEQLVVALKKAETGGVLQMKRSNKKGGWVNKDAYPWAVLSKEAPGGEMQSQFDSIMNSGHVAKKKFAIYSKQLRHGVLKFNEQRERENKK